MEKTEKTEENRKGNVMTKTTDEIRKVSYMHEKWKETEKN